MKDDDQQHLHDTGKATEIQRELRTKADPAVAAHSQRFFKTGKGEYGEGDFFLGVRVPVIRRLAGAHRELTLTEILEILSSRYHEERLLALILMVNRFAKADQGEQKRIYDAYLNHTGHINSWDLVDSSAHQIVGGYLMARDRSLLQELARSASLWERRIAIIATYHFIQRGQFDDTLAIARLLLTDPEDLIHKAVGWMLREVGNRERSVEEGFLIDHYRQMPRTMLRYAIEKFEPATRQAFLTGRL